MKNLNNKYYFARALIFLCIFFTSIYVVYLNTGNIPTRITWNGWAFYEWLINYEAGFVRRGIAGALLASFAYGHEVEYLNIIVFINAFAFFALSFLVAIRLNKYSYSGLIYLLCPSGIFWMAISNEYYYRKEIIFYVAILFISFAYAAWVRFKWISLKFIMYSLIIISSVLLPFLHEGFIFFSAFYFSIIIYAIARNDFGKVMANKFIIGYGLFCFIQFLILSLYKGDLAYSTIIWESISNQAKNISNSNVPAGGISAIGWSTFKGLSLSVAALISGVGTYYIFPIILVYAVVSFIFSEVKSLSYKNAITDKNMIINFCIVLFTFLPLFALGWDWGRWVAGIFMVFSSLVIFDLLLPCAYLLDKFQIKSQSKKIIFIILVVLSLFTRVPECCIGGSGSSFITNPSLNIKSSIKDLINRW